MSLPVKLSKIKKTAEILKNKFFHLGKLEKIVVVLAIFGLVQIVSLLFLFGTSLQDSRSALAAAAEKLTLKESKESTFTITSKYGFKLSFDSNLFQAAGYVFSNSTNFNIYTDKDLLKPESYALVEIYPKSVKGEYIDVMMSTSIRKDFFSEKRKKFGAKLSDLEVTIKHFEPISDKEQSYKLLKKDKIKLGSVEYTRLQYKASYSDKSLAAALKDNLVTKYITLRNDRPYVISISHKTDKSSFYQAIVQVIKNIEYSAPSKDAFFTLIGGENPLARIKDLKGERIGAVSGIYDRTKVLGETDNKDVKASTIRVVATNLPAVVRLATLYCGDISLVNPNKNTKFLVGNSLCGGGFGTGFFVSGDGYIGTNGHVVKLGPREALAIAILRGDRQVIGSVLKWATEVTYGYVFSQEQIDRAVNKIIINKSSLEQMAADILILPNEGFSVKNENTQYAVQLGKESINFAFGGKKSNSRFTFTDSVLEAKLVDYDYKSEDLVNITLDPKAGFTGSDVALLKVEGKNFPVVTMASIEGLVSGDELSVIGFPGLSENPLIDTSETKATATKGSVSSVRGANGNKKKLIQSDVSIDRGNSGGPAFNSEGGVVGIATYGIPSEGGTFNYMRDIQDLKDLISKKGISLDGTSETQVLWEKGLDKFLKSYYSASVKEFKKVLELYPQHVQAQEYISIAETKIANGEDRMEPIVMYTLAGSAAATIGVVLVIGFVIWRKRKTPRTATAGPTPQVFGVPSAPPQPLAPTPASQWSGVPSPPPAPTPPATPVSPVPTVQSSGMPPVPTPPTPVPETIVPTPPVYQEPVQSKVPTLAPSIPDVSVQPPVSTPAIKTIPTPAEANIPTSSVHPTKVPDTSMGERVGPSWMREKPNEPETPDSISSTVPDLAPSASVKPLSSNLPKAVEPEQLSPPTTEVSMPQRPESPTPAFEQRTPSDLNKGLSQKINS